MAYRLFTYSIVLFEFTYAQSCFSQENKLTNSEFAGELFESYAETQDLTSEDYQLIERLEYLRLNPIDINTATDIEFVQLPMLNLYQICEIIEYRNLHGLFLSTFELSGVKGLSSAVIREIQPFIKVENINIQPEFKKNRLYQSVMLNTARTIEKSEGYKDFDLKYRDSLSNKYFPGSPFRLKARYRLEYKNVSTGLSTENDPGEELFTGSNKTFDFISAYIQFKGKGIIKNAIAGDFNANFGQGLVLWTGFSPCKTSLATNILRTGGGFTKYSSFNENQYLRGVATTLQYKNVDFSLFLSKKSRDANILELDSSGKVKAVSSLQSTGIHALQQEIYDEDAIDETYMGTNIEFNLKRLILGGTYIVTNYSAAIQKDDRLYNLYSFSGKSSSAGSIYYNLYGRRFNLFGELAKSNSNGFANLTGITSELIPEITVAIAYRYYSPKYFSPYAQSFSQSNGVGNEEGVYFGVEYVPESSWKISAYADFFRFPWLKYQVNEPSYGNNYFAEISNSLNENTTVAVRYTYINKPTNYQTESQTIPAVERSIYRKYRAQLAFKASTTVELKNRIELIESKSISDGKQLGMLIYQDVKWQIGLSNIFILGRIAIFNTDGWESRIYAFENDVLYSFNIPAFSGKGLRAYSMMKWEIFRNLDFWIKYSITKYSDKNSIGDGPDLIKGNEKSDICVQCIYRF
jgi:hypothetical protein